MIRYLFLRVFTCNGETQKKGRLNHRRFNDFGHFEPIKPAEFYVASVYHSVIACSSPPPPHTGTLHIWTLRTSCKTLCSSLCAARKTTNNEKNCQPTKPCPDLSRCCNKTTTLPLRTRRHEQRRQLFLGTRLFTTDTATTPSSCRLLILLLLTTYYLAL